jgi:CheY-like chemotaxis protein
MVVEDDDLNRLLVGELLIEAGFDVAFAKDGIQALERFRQWAPDAVLMDVHMPRMDGIEATRALRLMHRDGEIAPCFIIGTTADPGLKAECLSAGMNEVLLKPLDVERLLAMLGAAGPTELRQGPGGPVDAP